VSAEWADEIEYRIEKPLSVRERVSVYSAVRESDGLSVVLKRYRDEMDAWGNSTEREFEILKRVAGPGVPRAIELVESVRPAVLVIEQVPGSSLLSWVESRLPSIEQLVEVAVQLVGVVRRVHDARILHRDLHPGNVIVDPATFRVHLVDFGIARSLLQGRERGAPQASMPGGCAGHVQFIAPEQTGRMGRGVDVRSDLYALGATLYFAATGIPPFEGADALAVIHAHMARMPDSPSLHRPELPTTISRILLKLLAKEPEDRYQTAQALHTDLVECQSQLQSLGRIDDGLPLASADAPLRPLFSKRLYGRSKEQELLFAAYARAAAGQLDWVLLRGAPGSGKSALVHELRKPVAASGAYLASGKFDLYRRDVPYSAWVTALDSLVQQILTESEERLTQWQRELRDGLGAIAGVLFDWVPDLAAVLGEVEPVPALGPRETQARLVLAVKRFLRACARREHPLVVFLDDLQWADGASRNLLEALSQESDAALLIIGAYRADDAAAPETLESLLDQLRKRKSPAEEIDLGELSEEHVQELLADVLGQPRERLGSITTTVMRRTGSNPLLVQQFVLHLHGLGLLHFDLTRRCWIWDDDAIDSAAIPEGAVQLLTAKLSRIEPQVRAVLELASCIGDEFDLSSLAELSDWDEAEISPRLYELLEQGLLATSSRGFRFVHDRVREAAQALLSEQQRIDLHLRIARLLEAQPTFDVHSDRAFELADHWNHAGESLAEEDRYAVRWANQRAGLRALQAGAATTADHYFRGALSRLSEGDLESDPSGALALFRGAAEAAHQQRDPERAIALLERALLLHLGHEDRVRVRVQQIAPRIVQDPGAGFDQALSVLRSVGLRIPRRPSRVRVMAEMLWTVWCLRNLRALDPSSDPGDPTRELQREVIRAAGAAVLSAGLRTVACLTMRSLHIELRSPPYSRLAFSLCSFGNSCFSLGKSWRWFHRYVGLSSEWAPKSPLPERARTECVLGMFSLPLLEARRGLAHSLESTAETLAEVGDQEYASYAKRARLHMLALTGERLPVLQELASAASSGPLLAVYRFLEQGNLDELPWEGMLGKLEERLQGISPLRTLVVRVHWMVVLCLARQYLLAWQLMQRMEPWVDSSTAFGGAFIDLLMYQGLCAAELAWRETRSGARRRYRRTLTRCVRELRIWSSRGPDHAHLRTLLEAELAALNRSPAFALRALTRCSEQARAHGMIHIAALAHERRAAVLMRSALMRSARGRESQLALQQACAEYLEWGALAKVEQLQRIEANGWEVSS